MPGRDGVGRAPGQVSEGSSNPAPTNTGEGGAWVCAISLRKGLVQTGDKRVRDGQSRVVREWCVLAGKVGEGLELGL